MGLKLVSPKEHAAKIIFTIQLSEGQSSKTVGDALYKDILSIMNQRIYKRITGSKLHA